MVQFMEPEPQPGPKVARERDAIRFVRSWIDDRPWHLWLVGILSLLWNSFGALDYTMSQLHNRAYLGSAAASMGISAEEMIAFIDSFPGWMHGLWALGVWGALLGSILLLIRHRFAVWSFAASLFGLAATQLYQASVPQPEWMETAVPMTVAIWSIASFLLIYAISMRRKGVLR